MNITYEFSQQEISMDSLANFQKLYSLERLKAMVVKDSRAGYQLRGSLEIRIEEHPEGVSAQECPRVAGLCARLFDETPIAFLAAPSALMSAEIYWATLARHTRVDCEEMGGKIVYKANSKRRWNHTQRFRTKIFELGASLGVAESYCNQQFVGLITAVNEYDFERQDARYVHFAPAGCSPWRRTPETMIMQLR